MRFVHAAKLAIPDARAPAFAKRMAAASRRLTTAFRDGDSGATALEYALMGSLLAILLVIALTNFGHGLSTEFSEISGAVK